MSVRSMLLLALPWAVSVSACASEDAALRGEADGGTPTVEDAATKPVANACTLPVRAFEHGPDVRLEPEAVGVLDVRRFPNARCNDGTPAAFRMRRGIGEGAKRFVLFLEGGGQCTTVEECSVREKVGSDEDLNDPRRVVFGPDTAILSGDPTENPDLYDATLVFLPYCSSDLWSGDRAGDGRPFAKSDLSTWQFNGRAIVSAAVQQALDDWGMKDATDVVFGGRSAGAFGVLVNLDDVARKLPPSARFLAVMDAGFAFDHPGFDPKTGSAAATRPLTETITRGVALWNGRGNAVCDEALRPFGRAHACYEGPTVLGGFAHPPVLVLQSLADRVFLAQLGLEFPRNGAPPPSAGAYVDGYKQAARATLTSVGNMHSVFAIDSFGHGLLRGSWRSSIQFAETPSASVRDAVSEFVRDPCSARRRVQ